MVQTLKNKKTKEKQGSHFWYESSDMYQTNNGEELQVIIIIIECASIDDD